MHLNPSLGTNEDSVDVLITYLMALIGNTNLAPTDLLAGLDLCVAPDFGGKVPLAYVDEGIEVNWERDNEELRLIFEFVNYSEIVYGWPQFCKMALGDSKKIWTLITNIDIGPISVCTGDNLLGLNERAILLMLHHRERQFEQS